MQWRDDSDGCWALLSNGIVVGAYGPDKSKEGYFRGFAFDIFSGQGTHEAIWPDEVDVKTDIESWFDAEGKLKPYADRKVPLNKM